MCNNISDIHVTPHQSLQQDLYANPQVPSDAIVEILSTFSVAFFLSYIIQTVVKGIK